MIDIAIPLGSDMSAPTFMKCLCQDCLSIRWLPELMPGMEGGGLNGDGSECACDCGGEVCPCGSCVATAQMLESGVRDPDSLGVRGPINQWNPVTGIRV
ncbi:hypothetical protein C7401_12643 [Paraburkholderia unamae]|uniref:hypothetical protein n=1 Tax=Paraburkholderia unamae TaxID=219649 RepID=UPI000DC4D8A6|nr:hypothetical protein [Paraburkholderia unamae]RAR53869.1 hypothetical protein C7401_12643 [Paraburkholderia unamae]